MSGASGINDWIGPMQGMSETAKEIGVDSDALVDPDLWLYRDRCTALLKRYLRYSIEVGRLPSLLGREFFRSHVTSYTTGTFEDAVIFVHDMEQALAELSEFQQKVIARVIFQDYSQEEAGRLLGCGRRSVVRRLAEALDRLSEILLRGGLLNRLPKTCQEGDEE